MDDLPNVSKARNIAKEAANAKSGHHVAVACAVLSVCLERGKAASAEDSGHYITREITTQPDVVLRNRAADDRWFASLAPSDRYNYRRGSIESQPCNDGKSVTLTCIDGDPFAPAASTVFAELGRAHRRRDQTRCPEHIRNSAGTIVTDIIKRPVTATIAVRLRAKLICSPNCSLNRYRRFFGAAA